MNLSRSVKKLLGIICAIVLCASFSAAAASKKSTHKAAAKATASSSHPATKSSKHGKAVARAGSKKSRKSAHATKASAKKPRGQQAIDGDRAREIQQALIRQGYLDGEPNGSWDQRTKDAMTRFQNDNGWQTKIIPDSRALIKLGLGPKHANLLNAESFETLPEAAREVRPGGGTPQR